MRACPAVRMRMVTGPGSGGGRDGRGGRAEVSRGQAADEAAGGEAEGGGTEGGRGQAADEAAGGEAEGP